ncbi:MAG: hypothetical protein KIT57_00955 [Blastocatellales bacterium]|nr:hypothetical protein [Blastocatellales bacterium]
MSAESFTEKSIEDPKEDPKSVVNQILPVPRPRMMAACAAALVVPGAGHLVLGRTMRAAAIGLGIAAMFILGFVMEGHLHTPVQGEWLTWFFTILDAGIGAPYAVCLALNLGFEVTPDQAAKITFEYGNTFLMVAGALNMLAVLDVYDIAVGRKQ